MTDFPGDQADVTALSSFERWVETARPQTQLWRIVLGVMIAGSVWILWTLVVAFAYAFGVGAGGGVGAAQLATEDIVNAATPMAMIVMLITFLGLWIGVWLAVRLMHGPKFWLLVSVEGRIRWREFGVGALLFAGYLALGLAPALFLGLSPYRSDVSLEQWALFAVPIAVLVFFQSTGEELLFRGYLLKHLAARFRHPLVWGFLPALVFGLLHYTDQPAPAYGYYYVTSTVLFGLVAAALVWRTGGLSAAIGMHVVNNVFGFLIAGPEEMNATSLWRGSTADMMASAPYDLAALAAVLAFILSPWAPFPKRQVVVRRNETRAAP